MVDFYRGFRNSLIAGTVAFGLGGCVTDDDGNNRLEAFALDVFETIAEVPVGLYDATVNLDPLNAARIPARMAGRLVNSTGHLVDQSIPAYSREVGEDNNFSDSYIWDGIGAGLVLGVATPLTLFEGAVVGGTVGVGADYLLDE